MEFYEKHVLLLEVVENVLIVADELRVCFDDTQLYSKYEHSVRQLSFGTNRRQLFNLQKCAHRAIPYRDLAQVHRRAGCGEDRFCYVWLNDSTTLEKREPTCAYAYDVHPRITLTSEEQRSLCETWEYFDEIREEAELRDVA